MVINSHSEIDQVKDSDNSANFLPSATSPPSLNPSPHLTPTTLPPPPIHLQIVLHIDDY